MEGCMQFKTLLTLSFLFFCQLSSANNTQNLQKALDKARADNQVSAIQMTVILPNQEVITVSSGSTKQKQGSPILPETLFQIGSETKSFTAALLLKLEHQGKLKLTDTLDKYLPFYKQWSKVTLEQLLHNNSGIPNYSEDKGFQKLIEEKPNYQWQAPELIAFAAKHPMDFEPGKAGCRRFR
jgi:D-alanyl-D-alanine carboxypeptidase